MLHPVAKVESETDCWFIFLHSHNSIPREHYFRTEPKDHQQTVLLREPGLGADPTGAKEIRSSSSSS